MAINTDVSSNTNNITRNNFAITVYLNSKKKNDTKLKLRRSKLGTCLRRQENKLTWKIIVILSREIKITKNVIEDDLKNIKEIYYTYLKYQKPKRYILGVCKKYPFS